MDQLFNSSEKRLARVLLLMAEFGKPGEPESLIPKISQETLAEMIGSTRSRVSFFMNRFRKLGFIDYNGRIRVNKSLLNIILHDKLPGDNATRPKYFSACRKADEEKSVLKTDLNQTARDLYSVDASISSARNSIAIPFSSLPGTCSIPIKAFMTVGFDTWIELSGLTDREAGYAVWPGVGSSARSFAVTHAFFPSDRSLFLRCWSFPLFA